MTTHNLTERESIYFELVIQFTILIMICYFIYKCINSESFKREWEQAERDSERNQERLRQWGRSCREGVTNMGNQVSNFVRSNLNPIGNMQTLSQVVLYPGSMFANSVQSAIGRPERLSNNSTIRSLQNAGINFSVDQTASLIDSALIAAVPEIMILRAAHWLAQTAYRMVSSVVPMDSPVQNTRMLESGRLNDVEADMLPELLPDDEEENEQRNLKFKKQ